MNETLTGYTTVGQRRYVSWYIILWFQVVQSNTNHLHAITWFQVTTTTTTTTNDNNNDNDKKLAELWTLLSLQTTE